jgi:spermidine synthase
MALVEQLTTPRGELVLREVDGHYEVISNGTFLMDTRTGESERLLVRAALTGRSAPAAVLIGGLGIGFSLVEAISHPTVTRVVVVEIEAAIVDWHRTHLAVYSAGALSDPRTTVVVADLRRHLQESEDRYDVICLDVDNGPDWTVTDANAALYDDGGTALIRSRLTADGILSVWSAARSPAYEAVLHRHFDEVRIHEVAVRHGQPDVVMVGSVRRD